MWLKFESGAGGVRMPGRAMSETTECGRKEPQESEVGARRPAAAPAEKATPRIRRDRGPSSGAGATWELVGRDNEQRPSKPPAHVAEDPARMLANILQGMQKSDADVMCEFMLLNQKQQEAKCKECGVLVSGTKLCRALELTASGASPGAETFSG